MTEKDFFKINDLKLENVSYLKVILEIKEIKKLIDEINRFND